MKNKVKNEKKEIADSDARTYDKREVEEDPPYIGARRGTKRIYYRGLSALTYGLRGELERLRKMPRVIKAKALKLNEDTKGSQYQANADVLTPKDNMAQILYVHYNVIPPGGMTDKHGHMNEAIFYILDGKGHEVHDGVRYDWEAGDLVIVQNACVHQHFNDDANRPARYIVIKSKPIFLFMNLLMQGVVERASRDHLPGHENFKATFFPE